MIRFYLSGKATVQNVLVEEADDGGTGALEVDHRFAKLVIDVNDGQAIDDVGIAQSLHHRRDVARCRAVPVRLVDQGTAHVAFSANLQASRDR